VTRECFLCGRSFWHSKAENGRFCSARCQGFYDAGSRKIEFDSFAARYRVVAGDDPGRLPEPMKRGPRGWFVPCRHCGAEFESMGLAYCSEKCRFDGHQNAVNSDILAEVDMEAIPKKTCEVCARKLPRWKGGKRVRSNQRFCSSRCQRRAARVGPRMRQHPGATFEGAG